jgi:hypothetical protein
MMITKKEVFIMKCFENLRKNLNDYVREKGNEIVPELLPIMPKMTHQALFKKSSYGLGDFLTQKVTYAKVGTMVGLAAPTIAYYLTSNSAIEAIMTTIVGFPITLITTGTGLGVGKLLDKKQYERKYR